MALTIYFVLRRCCDVKNQENETRQTILQGQNDDAQGEEGEKKERGDGQRHIPSSSGNGSDEGPLQAGSNTRRPSQ